MLKKYLNCLFYMILSVNFVLSMEESCDSPLNSFCKLFSLEKAVWPKGAVPFIPLACNNQKIKSLKELACQKLVKGLFEDFLSSELFQWSTVLTADLKKDTAWLIVKKNPATFWNCFMSLAEVSVQEIIMDKNSLTTYWKELEENFFNLELSFEFFIEEKIVFTQIDELSVNMTLSTNKSFKDLNEKIERELFILNFFKLPVDYKFIDKNYTQINFLNINEDLKGSIRSYSIYQILNQFDLEEIILITFLQNLAKDSNSIKIENKKLLRIFNNFPKQIQEILTKKFNIVL